MINDLPMINLHNLKHAIVPVHHAGVGGDPSKRFLHVTLAAGNDTPGRTAEVRRRAAETLGNLLDEYTAGLPGLVSLRHGCYRRRLECSA
jgi:5-carboxymethyl-2-hydroxymuconate isomerase